MGIICLNCKKSLGCGCQKRVASNGVSACTTCIGTYEQQIKKVTTPIPSSNAPTGINITFNGLKPR